MKCYGLQDCLDIDYSRMDDGEVEFEIPEGFVRVDFRDWIYDVNRFTIIDVPEFNLKILITQEDKVQMLRDTQENKGPEFADVKFKWEVEHEEPQKR